MATHAYLTNNFREWCRKTLPKSRPAPCMKFLKGTPFQAWVEDDHLYVSASKTGAMPAQIAISDSHLDAIVSRYFFSVSDGVRHQVVNYGNNWKTGCKNRMRDPFIAALVHRWATR